MKETIHEAEMKRTISFLRITKAILVSYLFLRIVVSFVIPAVTGFQYITFWSSTFWMELLKEISLLTLAWTGCDYATVLLRLLGKLLSNK